jgi:lysophospholipase L1-like esterase
VHINSRGTRGPEFEAAKPADVIRILSLGDSKTFGWGLTEAETYSGRLQALLQERAPAGKRIEVINAGVNAWSYPQIKVFLKEHGLLWKPDFVLIGDANLWTQFSEDSDPAFVDKMLSRVRLKNLLRRSAVYHFVIEVQLNHVYQKYRTKFIPIDPKQDQLFKEAQKSDPNAFFRKAIEEACALATAGGARPVVMFIPILGEWETGPSKDVQAAKRELCERLKVPFVDFGEDIKPPAADDLYLDADPVHLNAKGNELVAQRLASVFAPLLAK